jgi:hypothetical protein
MRAIATRNADASSRQRLFKSPGAAALTVSIRIGFGVRLISRGAA